MRAGAFSVFKWDKGGASIEGVDETTVGLLDEHKLSIPDLGERYCTDLNPDRPEQSPGMDEERAKQVQEVKIVLVYLLLLAAVQQQQHYCSDALQQCTRQLFFVLFSRGCGHRNQLFIHRSNIPMFTLHSYTSQFIARTHTHTHTHIIHTHIDLSRAHAGVEHDRAERAHAGADGSWMEAVPQGAACAAEPDAYHRRGLVYLGERSYDSRNIYRVQQCYCRWT